MLQEASLALVLSIVLAACRSPLGGDTTPPEAVTDLEAIAEAGRVTLTWSDPTDSDISLVRVSWSRGGTEALEIDLGTQAATIEGPANGTEYTFTIVVVDQDKNESDPITVTVTPLTPLGSYAVTYDDNGADQTFPTMQSST